MQSQFRPRHWAVRVNYPDPRALPTTEHFYSRGDAEQYRLFIKSALPAAHVEVYFDPPNNSNHHEHTDTLPTDSI